MSDIQIHAVNRNMYGVNSYVVTSDKEAMIIDTPFDPFDTKAYDSLLLLSGAEVKYIIYTHGHYDHIGGSDTARLHYKNAKHIAHELEVEYFTDASFNLSGLFGENITLTKPDSTFKDNDTFTLGSHTFKVIHTPGHSKGGVCFYTEGHLFSGDTIFSMGVGRTDFKGSSTEDLEKSIKEKIFTLPDETLIYAGHGEYGTTLKQRKSFGI